jgi:hypothetical protein
MKQYTIDGQPRYDPQLLFNAAKSNVVKLLASNKQNKANFVLTCQMEKVDMKTAQAVIEAFNFATKNTVVLESTDVSDLFNESVNRNNSSKKNFHFQLWRYGR